MNKEQLLSSFGKIRSKEDLANLINEVNRQIFTEKSTVQISGDDLDRYSRFKLTKNYYRCFFIQKKSGTKRLINAPKKELKSIQRVLNYIFQATFTQHESAKGFKINSSIVDNAKLHTNKKYVLNIDLKDFFHSFDRYKIKWLLTSEPLFLDGEREPLAFLIACLCTYPIEFGGKEKYVLPQGSPCSPILTNILCKKLDVKLTGLSNRFGLTYSRYADDITFSGQTNFYKKPEFKEELYRIIEISQNFIVNENKIRYQIIGNHQEVTGLTVNSKVNIKRRYVKQLRMWLYYWEKYGYTKAEFLFKRDYLRDKGHTKSPESKMENVLSGKLDFLKMVKGISDPTYIKLHDRFLKLFKNLRI